MVKVYKQADSRPSPSNYHPICHLQTDRTYCRNQGTAGVLQESGYIRCTEGIRLHQVYYRNQVTSGLLQGSGYIWCSTGIRLHQVYYRSQVTLGILQESGYITCTTGISVGSYDFYYTSMLCPNFPNTLTLDFLLMTLWSIVRDLLYDMYFVILVSICSPSI